MVTWALSLSVGRSLGQSACLGFPLVTTSRFNVVVRVLEEEPETAKDIAPSSAGPGSPIMETAGLIPGAVRGTAWPLRAGRKHGAKNRGFRRSHSHLRGPSETPASLSFPISKTDTLRLTGLVCPGKSKIETQSGASLSCSLKETRASYDSLVQKARELLLLAAQAVPPWAVLGSAIPRRPPTFPVASPPHSTVEAHVGQDPLPSSRTSGLASQGWTWDPRQATETIPRHFLEPVRKRSLKVIAGEQSRQIDGEGERGV